MNKSTLTAAILLSAAVSRRKRSDTPGYAGEDLSSKVTVSRDREEKTAVLTVTLPGEWELYAGAAPETIDLSAPILTGSGAGSYTLPVPAGTRSYFQFETGGNRAILAERQLPMSGGFNMRDLGGYRTSDGRHVKWGRIIRSDDLHSLTDEDLAYLASIPVKTVADFRSPQEVRAMPDKLSPQGMTYVGLPITPGSLDDLQSYIAMTPEEVEAKMEWMNVYFATSDEGRERYREFFRLLKETDDAAILFHCSAGKDRTGMGAALILYALGVPEQTVMEDYLASNGYLAGKYSRYAERFPQLKGMLEVKPNYLSAGIDSIRTAYGSVETYLREELGADIGKLREFYLD